MPGSAAARGINPVPDLKFNSVDVLDVDEKLFLSQRMISTTTESWCAGAP
jgi:hypothetical protein